MKPKIMPQFVDCFGRLKLGQSEAGSENQFPESVAVRMIKDAHKIFKDKVLTGTGEHQAEIEAALQIVNGHLDATAEDLNAAKKNRARFTQPQPSPSNATQTISGNVSEHPGASQGPAVSADQAQIRQSEGGQAGGGDSLLNREGVSPTPKAPKLNERQFKQQFGDPFTDEDKSSLVAAYKSPEFGIMGAREHAFLTNLGYDARKDPDSAGFFFSPDPSIAQKIEGQTHASQVNPESGQFISLASLDAAKGDVFKALQIEAAKTPLTNKAAETAAKLARFLDKAIARSSANEQVRSTLDGMEADGITPKDVVTQFWKDTWNKLSPEAQKKVGKYIESVHGLKPGDVVSYDPKTQEEFRAKDWQDIYPASEAPTDILALEGIEKGLVALMHHANQGVGQMRNAAESTQVSQPELPQSTVESESQGGQGKTGGASGAPSSDGQPAAPAKTWENTLNEEYQRLTRKGVTPAKALEGAVKAVEAAHSDSPILRTSDTKGAPVNIKLAKQFLLTKAEQKLQRKMERTGFAHRPATSIHFENDPVIATLLGGFGKIMSSAVAKKTPSDEPGVSLYEKYSDLWGGEPSLQSPTHRMIFGGRHLPSEAAQFLADEGAIPDGYPDTMWNAIDRASKTAARLASEEAQQRRVEKEASKGIATPKQNKNFERDALANDPNANAIDVHDLHMGDVVDVNGEKLKVTAIDEDGNVTLEDGKKYGIQTVQDGHLIYVEGVEHKPRKGGFLPEGDENTGLFNEGDMPFNLVSETKQEREAREAKETAERIRQQNADKAKAAAEADKQQERIDFDQPATIPAPYSAPGQASYAQPEQHGNLPHELQEPNPKLLANPVIREQYRVKTQRAIDENRPVNPAMADALGIPLTQEYADATDVKSAEEQSAGAKDNPFPQEAPPQIPPNGMKIKKFFNDVKRAEGSGLEGGFIDPTLLLRAVGVSPDAATRAVAGTLGTWAGETFPKTTARDRVLGEKAARWVSSKIAAPFLSDLFSQSVAGDNTSFDFLKFGTMLSEDQLRGIKDAFLKAGDTKASNAVVTTIGAPDAPFKTEAEYQAYMADPATQQALDRYRTLWDGGVEPMYKQAMMIDPSTTLPKRGLQTGTHANLFAEDPNNPARGKSVWSVGQGNLQGTRQRKSPFGRKAKGTGKYNTDLRAMMDNTFGKQLEIANKNEFEKELVRTGNAVIDDPGQPVTLPDGEGTSPFELKHKLIVRDKDGVVKTFTITKNIYVRDSLAGEYQRGSNVERWPVPAVFKGIATVLNKSALAGLTDATVHLSNLATVLFTRPIGNPIVNGLMALTGRADIPYVLGKVLIKSMQSGIGVQRQLARLAEIGALREDYPSRNPGHKLIHAMDRAVRLVMDDAFENMAKMGLVPNTETARREFVNQVGQYNKRAQGDFMTLMRNTIAPFATAGRNFNVLGIRTATLNPGVPAKTLGSSVILKGNMLAKWLGFAVLAGTLNYLLTKDKGGGVLGRPGVKIGHIDTGTEDANGRPLTINALDLVGLGRGLRVTGTRGVIESYRNDLPGGVVQDSAIRDIVNSNISPFAGPIIHFGFGIANASPAIDVGKPFPVVPPGESQLASNFVHSLKEANPLIASYFDMDKPGATKWDWLRRQLPRFMMNPSNPPDMMDKYPEIVHKAQLNTYLDDVVHRARKMEPDARRDYLDSIMETLSPEDRQTAMRQFRYRRVR